MVRVVNSENGVVIDGRQRMPGRGAYVHRDRACAVAAVRGGLARALRCGVPVAFVDFLEREAARNQ